MNHPKSDRAPGRVIFPGWESSLKTCVEEHDVDDNDAIVAVGLSASRRLSSDSVGHENRSDFDMIFTRSLRSPIQCQHCILTFTQSPDGEGESSIQ